MSPARKSSSCSRLPSWEEAAPAGWLLSTTGPEQCGVLVLQAAECAVRSSSVPGLRWVLQVWRTKHRASRGLEGRPGAREARRTGAIELPLLEHPICFAWQVSTEHCTAGPACSEQAARAVYQGSRVEGCSCGSRLRLLLVVWQACERASASHTCWFLLVQELLALPPAAVHRQHHNRRTHLAGPLDTAYIRLERAAKFLAARCRACCSHRRRSRLPAQRPDTQRSSGLMQGAKVSHALHLASVYARLCLLVHRSCPHLPLLPSACSVHAGLTCCKEVATTCGLPDCLAGAGMLNCTPA